MFVPGDNFYAAAVERDPALFEDAAAQRVIIVTPATLIALAKAVVRADDDVSARLFRECADHRAHFL